MEHREWKRRRTGRSKEIAPRQRGKRAADITGESSTYQTILKRRHLQRAYRINLKTHSKI